MCGAKLEILEIVNNLRRCWVNFEKQTKKGPDQKFQKSPRSDFFLKFLAQAVSIERQRFKIIDENWHYQEVIVVSFLIFLNSLNHGNHSIIPLSYFTATNQCV